MVKVDDFEVVEGLYYSKDYMWVKVEDGKARVGLSDYAQRKLKQILVLDIPASGSTLKQFEPFGTVESIKVVTDVISPLSGVVVEVNKAVQDDPGLINEDPFGGGWLILVDPSNLDEEIAKLMDFKKAVEWHKELAKE